MSNFQRKLVAICSFLLFCVAIISNKSLAQGTRTVSGTIVNSQTGEPVSGATVSANNSKRGTSTDEKGHFKLTVNQGGALLISSVGYDQQEIMPGADGIVTIKLVSNNQQLSDVVVVGYGTRKKATLTGAIATIDSKIFQDRGPTANPLAALQGQVPGVVVTRSAAAPG